VKDNLEQLNNVESGLDEKTRDIIIIAVVVPVVGLSIIITIIVCCCK
jgi:hypothetical protein